MDTLVEAILRESAVGVPTVSDLMLIAFARTSHYRDEFRERRRSTSPEEDIAKTVGDRILVTVGRQDIELADLSPLERKTSPIAREVVDFGVYGRVGRESSAESESPLERRGIELAEQGQYAEARSFFERVLPIRAEPLYRAQVLQNIMLTYKKEGNQAGAIETGQDILEVFGLMQTPDGTYLHGQIVGDLRRLQRHSF